MDFNLNANNNDNNDEGGGGGKGKRKGINSSGNSDSNGNSNSTLKGILASLILLEEEVQQRAIFDTSYDHQVRAMNHYIDDAGSALAYAAAVAGSDDAGSDDAGSADAGSDDAGSDDADSDDAGSDDAGSDDAGSDDAGSDHGSVELSSSIGSSVPQQQNRKLWLKDLSKDWWERCSHRDFPEDDFRWLFRMSKGTFDMICDELESVVMKKNTMRRDAIPVGQRVAVCIWWLATGDPLRLVSKRFGLGISTCRKLVFEVCSAIKIVLMPKFLCWPDEANMERNKEEFEGISGIPNVWGAMYTTHVSIIAPKINVAGYFNKRHTERNQKTSYSLTAQGVVDPKGIFTDVCIGWPGSLPDDQVLEKSALYQRAQIGLLKDVWIVGNSGHPLMDWALVPYTHQNLTWTQHAFNEKVGEIQMVAKEAFARLKGRWSCLQKRTRIKLLDLPVMIGAACVLHNICEIRNEEMDPEWKFDLFDDEMVAQNSIRSANSMQARDHIAHYLLQKQTFVIIN